MSNSHHQRRGLRSASWLFAIALGLFALLGACTSDGVELPIETSTTSEQPPETEPPTTEPPATQPPETAPPAEGGTTEEGLSTEDWVLIGLLGVAILAIILAATSGATNRKQANDAARAQLNGRLNEIVGSSRWINDQGSIEVLRVNDAAQLQASWSSVRPRLIDLEGRVATLAAGTGNTNLDQALSNLGQSVAGLRGALESNVSLRLGADAANQAALIQTTTQTVNERRQQLQAAIAPVAAART